MEWRFLGDVSCVVGESNAFLYLSRNFCFVVVLALQKMWQKKAAMESQRQRRESMCGKCGYSEIGLSSVVMVQANVFVVEITVWSLLWVGRVRMGLGGWGNDIDSKETQQSIVAFSVVVCDGPVSVVGGGLVGVGEGRTVVWRIVVVVLACFGV